MARQRIHYHREAMKLLGWSNSSVLAEVGRLAEVETRLVRTLPASVREWIVYFGDLDFCRCTGQDHAVESSRLGQSIGVTPTERYDAVADGYLILMWENQGCCYWAVSLREEVDPPVFQTGSLRASRREWQLVAPRFSDFVLARMWSMGRIFDARYNWLTIGGPFGPRELAFARATMKEGPTTTDWPCAVHRHFSYRGAYLWVFSNQWMAGSSKRSNLTGLTRRVWWLAGTGAESFNGDFAGELVSLRAKPPAYPGPDWDELFGEPLDERFANGCYLDSREDEAVVPPALDELLDDFDEVHRRSLDGGLLALTLSRPGQRIFLVTGNYRDPDAKSAWWLHGDDVANLTMLVRHLRRWGTLATTLRATTDAGREAMQMLAGE